MRIARLASLALALLPATLSAQAVPPPPPPPVIVTSGYEPSVVSTARLLEFEPGGVRCGTETVTPDFVARPFVTSTYIYPAAKLEPVTLAFRIAADGRPLGIGDPSRQTGIFLPTDDLAPTLAAWRFAPGAQKAGCTATFVPRATTMEAAPMATVYRYLGANNFNLVQYPVLRKRFREASGGDCYEGDWPAMRMRAFPDYQAIPQPPGTSSFTLTGFDIDDAGRPVHIRTLYSDGNAALDKAAYQAVAQSRFVPGARTGCSFPFARRQNLPVAPPVPPEAAFFRARENTCDPDRKWTLPALTFPEPFRRRAIEGWALIGFDVAPWGATGNVRVLASEPAAAFGAQAKRIIEMSKQPVSPTGASGCVDRVKFVLPGPGMTVQQQAEAPPPF